tara:strand:- start:310 stop:2274 length:1965 start_codon:yes stop_codon:yes gene_type:complete
MSIEDINHLKANSIKQSYTFLVDSNERNRIKYPNPNNYTVEFSTPFKNVIGMEVIDASIPRTMYNIDFENNSIYYYIGYDENDELIKNGITVNINSDLVITYNDIINNSLRLRNRNYAFIKNQVNLYNIYNKNDIGGESIGITFTFTIKTSVIYKDYQNADNSYTVLDFNYNHIINPSTLDYSPIVIKLVRLDIPDDETQQIFNLLLRIGTETNEFILYNINLNDFTHITWCISSNNIWTIYLNSITDSSKTYTSSKEIKNVFYTEKYIGKKYGNENGDWDTGSLFIKNFKIYNKVLNQTEVSNCMNNVNTESNLPIIWYKMDEESNILKNYGNTYNNDYPELINYKDIFSKINIEPGNYTFKRFIDIYDNGANFEIGFMNNSEPSELTNLINIYSKKPFILDMDRSKISENIGFDLHANASNSLNKYNYKNIYKNNPNMAKMFHSILNNIREKEFSNGFVDNYKVVSPGIVYFIGNKYIIMKCPEIEEHLYRSLSYSKFTLGLAKFRVDNVGINNEKLTITKIPVREFHPIGKLAKLSLRFETNLGSLYDFKGVNHNILFAIYYYEPVQKTLPCKSLLNPEYKMNYLEYKYSQEQIESDSDDEEEDFSRDNINDYKKNENMYSEDGVQLQKYNKLPEYDNNEIYSDDSGYSDK